MTIYKGKDFRLFIEKPINGTSEMFELACSKSMDISFKAEVKEITKPPDSVWKNYTATYLGYDISSDGVEVFNEDKVSGSYVLELMIARNPVLWMSVDIDNPEVYRAGHCIITSLNESAPVDGFKTFSISAIGVGPIKLINPYKQVVYGELTPQTVYGEQNNIDSYVMGYKERGDMPVIHE